MNPYNNEMEEKISSLFFFVYFGRYENERKEEKERQPRYRLSLGIWPALVLHARLIDLCEKAINEI